MSARSLTILLASLLLVTGAGCSQSSSAPSSAGQAQVATVPEKSGAELWAENCNRCHNIRPPQSFSDAQWHALVHHMRQRANLTGQEARAITVFLQSNNQ